MMSESTYPMLPVEEALEIVLAQCIPLPPATVQLADALGYVLAEPVVAADPLPPFRAAVKDGYAVVAADGPGVYPIIGEATAGKLPNFRVERGSVAYITTGAPTPEGADAVVMVEETEVLSGDNGHRRVRIRAAVRPGDDIRPVGVDVAAGEVVLEAGTRLGVAEVGLLATVGATTVNVHPRPRVAVLSTGDEVVNANRTPGPGQIRDSNRAMLLAAITAAGGVPVDAGISPDEPGQIQQHVLAGLDAADVLVTSGGVSMGELDLIKPLLERAGTVHFGRLLMKPGKPLTFATIERGGRRKLIFGLPGNPVSGLVTFTLFAIPAIRTLAGRRDPYLHRVQAQLTMPATLDASRPEYHRAVVHWDDTLNNGRGGYAAASTGSQSSSRLLSLRSANALLLLPRGEDTLPAGATVPAFLIGD